MAIVNYFQVLKEDTVEGTMSLPITVKVTDVIPGGNMVQGAAVANAAVPFADLTAAANAYNALLASLRAGGIIAT